MDKQELLEAVKKNGSDLQFASEKLKDDKDIAMTAVKKSGYSLEYIYKFIGEDVKKLINETHPIEKARLILKTAIELEELNKKISHANNKHKLNKI